MKKERDAYMTEEEIEDLLLPKCDFHVSPGFMERVTAEAEDLSVRWRRRRRLWLLSSAAVSLIILSIATAFFASKTETQTDTHVTASAVINIDETLQAPQEAVEILPKENYEETSQKKENSIVKNKIADKNHVILSENATHRHQSLETSETSVEKHNAENPTGKEGLLSCRIENLPQDSEKMLLTTEDCDDYTRMVRSAYIERVRCEIAETEAYVEEMRKNIYENI